MSAETSFGDLRALMQALQAMLDSEHLDGQPDAVKTLFEDEIFPMFR